MTKTAELSTMEMMANQKTRLPRVLLPADVGGKFTPKDIVPKKGAEYGSHDVHRKIRVVRTLKSGVFGYLPRNGHIYRVQWNEERERWDALERLEGKKAETAQAAISKERKQLRELAKAAAEDAEAAAGEVKVKAAKAKAKAAKAKAAA